MHQQPTPVQHEVLAPELPYVSSANPPHIREDNTCFEFKSMEKFCRGLGLDVGCGTNRLSSSVLTIDNYPHKDTDLLWDCWKDGKWNPYPFTKNVFDFVFSSHVLEDFPPHQIDAVFDEWLRLVKVGGYLVLLVPDIEGKRYPDIDEVWTAEDDLVKKGERRVGDLKGNPSHRIRMGNTVLNAMAARHSNITIVQQDTLPKDGMTMDFVVRKNS